MAVTVREPTDEIPLLLSTLAPSDRHRRAAFGICAAFLVAFAVVVPFAYTPLPRLEAWIPASTTALIITDLVTSTLLFSQFAIARHRALLVLATGYLFSALIVVPYALTFPGLFAPTGLLGADLQTAVWLYLIWHIASPASVIIYALLRDKGIPSSPPSDRSVRLDIGLAIGSAIVVVVAATWFVTAQHDLLPRLYVDRIRLSPVANLAAIAVFLACAAALALLWFRGSSVLDLWLIVTVYAWALEITLQGLFLTDRFSLAWYVGRIYSLMAASVVLIVLLSEASALYAHLARTAMRQRAARNSRQIAMDTMAASIAHEVNQPLGSIALNAEAALLYLAQTPPNTEEARAALHDIGSASARGSEVIATLRAMFRKGSPERNPVDTNALVRDVLAILDLDLRTAGVVVSVDLQENLPRPRADRVQLQQVLLNLATNAIEAMRPLAGRARRLRITSGPVEGASGIRITIEDTGAGIAQQDKDRVFEPFYSTKPAGTGIGLTICQSIIASHGGSLKASANTPYGTIFEVILPADTGPAA